MNQTKGKMPLRGWAGSSKQGQEWLGGGQVPVFPSGLGWAGQGGSQPPPSVSLQPAEETVPGGGSREGGTSLVSLFFLIIFERFPAPSPKLSVSQFPGSSYHTRRGSGAPLPQGSATWDMCPAQPWDPKWRRERRN